MTLAYRTPTYECRISRGAVVLDTNVLVAAFCADDQYHDDADNFVNDWEETLLVPVAVLIEAWGVIVGSKGDWQSGMKLLSWLDTPGNATLLPQDIARFDDSHRLIESIRVDCVDALLSHLVDDISSCSGSDFCLTVATYDAGDILRCREKHDLKIKVFDLRSFHEY